MNERTVTALYQTRSDAESAQDRLRAAGIDDVDIHDQSGSGATGEQSHGGLMDKMMKFFGGHEDAHAYSEGLRRGHFLLTARVDELRATEAASILDASSAVDFDRAQESWKTEGWTAPSVGTRAEAGRAEEVIPIVEERLVVGKREVERGGVRVRSYVVETPVRESIGLREEHVSVERRPVDRAVNAADASFKDREISLTETAEEAVVAKDAFVREELVVRKEASERVEEISDTVRRTEVEVEDTTRGGRTGLERDTTRGI